MTATATLSGLVNANANGSAMPMASTAVVKPTACVEAATSKPALRPLLEIIKETSLAPTEALLYAVCRSDAQADAKAWAASVEAAGQALDALLCAVARETVAVVNGTTAAPNAPSAKGSRRRLFDCGVIDLHDSEFFAWVGRVVALRGQCRSDVDVSWAYTQRRLVFAACIHLLKRRMKWRRQIAA